MKKLLLLLNSNHADFQSLPPLPSSSIKLGEKEGGSVLEGARKRRKSREEADRGRGGEEGEGYNTPPSTLAFG